MKGLSSEQCRQLLDWYALVARVLPWRETADPYHIWISEVMLQQTQVNTVLPRYLSWFNMFPDIQSLADAPLDDVLKAWEGLGYYRRARFLHAAARKVVDENNGDFPRQFDEILSLPGVGRSTAGAIASFCFSLSKPVLDGNVKRVLKRWSVTVNEMADAKLWLLAQQAIDQSDQPALWNQAMMELGATLCSAKSPKCGMCPLADSCASVGKVNEVCGNAPKTDKRSSVRDVHWQVKLYYQPECGLWLEKRPDDGIWGGLWTPPILEKYVPEQGAKPCYIHTLTHRRLHLYGEQIQQDPIGCGQWVKDISKFALPTGIYRLLQIYGLQMLE